MYSGFSSARVNYRKIKAFHCLTLMGLSATSARLPPVARNSSHPPERLTLFGDFHSYDRDKSLEQGDKILRKLTELSCQLLCG